MRNNLLRENAWLCPIGSLLLAGLLLLAFGLTWWDALLVLAMLACPLIWLWLFLGGKNR